MSIASVLTGAMVQTNTSQKALAEQVGVTQSYISQICAGKKTPTIMTLEKMGECLDIPLSRFFEEDAAQMQETAPSPKRMNLSEKEKQLVRFYRRMDRRGKAMIDGIVSSM